MYGDNNVLGLVPVSYTHLDVYKRQDESFPSGVFATPWGISCNGEYAAYCGYDTDEAGNVCCVVKAYGLDSRELITLSLIHI